jgi:hypothetical protein
MANEVNILFRAGIAFDDSQVAQAVNNMTQAVAKAPPINIRSSMGDTVDVGNAQTQLDALRERATAIDNIIIKQKTMKDSSGNLYTGLTDMVVKWKGANNEVFTSLLKIDSAVTSMGRGARLVAQETGELQVGKAVAQVTKEYNSKLKSFEAMENKATEWYNRAESMEKREKKAIQDSSTALKDKISQYRQALQANDYTTAGNLAVQIKASNDEMNKQIDLSKRSATGLRSWADSIQNAIKQALRSAQQLMNEAVKFAIDLNTEMTKIQVLQVEGAKTTEDIRALSVAYNELAQSMGTTTLEIAKGSVEWL